MFSSSAPLLPIGFTAAGNPAGDANAQAYSTAAKVLRYLFIEKGSYQSQSMNDFLSNIIGKRDAIVRDTLDSFLARLSTKYNFHTDEGKTYTTIRFFDDSALVIVPKHTYLAIVPEVIIDEGKGFDAWLPYAGASFILSIKNGQDIWLDEKLPLAWWALLESDTSDIDFEEIQNLAGVFFLLHPQTTHINIFPAENVAGLTNWKNPSVMVHTDKESNSKLAEKFFKGLVYLIENDKAFIGAFISSPGKLSVPLYRFKNEDMPELTLSAHEKMSLANAMR